MKLTEMAFKEAMADETAGAFHSAARHARFQFQGLRHTRRHYGRHQSAVYPPHAGDLGPSLKHSTPMRFTDEAQTRSPIASAWVPFSGGAHMLPRPALRLYAGEVLSHGTSCKISVSSWRPGYVPNWQMWPIPKPRDGLRVTLSPVGIGRKR